MVEEEFNLEVKQDSMKNPQGNSVIKRIHQVIRNMIKNFQVYARDDVDEDDL